MEREKDRIILLAGVSGSGKSTVANALCEQYGYKAIESYTTRPPRYEGERGHIFITREEFNQIPSRDMVAFTNFDRNLYCATKAQVEESDIYVIDLAGITEFMERYDGSKEPVVVALSVPPTVARDRMLSRGDKKKAVEERLANDAECFRDLYTVADMVIDAQKSVEDIVEALNDILIGEWDKNAIQGISEAPEGQIKYPRSHAEFDISFPKFSFMRHFDDKETDLMELAYMGPFREDFINGYVDAPELRRRKARSIQDYEYGISETY